MIDPLRITTREDASRTFVIVNGEVDMASAPDLERALLAVVNGDVVVDLSGVPFLDSAGIASLVRAQRAVAARGSRLTTTGEQSIVRDALEVTGVFDVLHSDGTDS